MCWQGFDDRRTQAAWKGLGLSTAMPLPYVLRTPTSLGRSRALPTLELIEIALRVDAARRHHPSQPRTLWRNIRTTGSDLSGEADGLHVVLSQDTRLRLRAYVWH
jgi:hypothetical protein